MANKITSVAAPSHITITERDEAGFVVSNYIHTLTDKVSGKVTKDGKLGRRSIGERVDVVLPEIPKSLTRKLVDIFLPVGYPTSVSDDYLGYQIYDSLQAICSSMASLLASRAVLEGVGVGNASATPTNALYFEIVQMSVGRVATIFFAYRFGTAIEPDCKMYRLLADVFNDFSMILDCLSPAFPRNIKMALLGASSMLVTLCGVIAGCAKSCLSSHFAKSGNLGDLNAKESSQETVISLFGMLLGSLMISRVSSPVATWSALLILQALHLLMNYLAVRSVSMRSLNQQRTNIVVSALVDQKRVLSPREVSQREYIFIKTGNLTWHGQQKIGFCCPGASMSDLLQRMSANRERSPRSIVNFDASVANLLRLFEKDKYILWFEQSTRVATIVFKQNCQATDQIKAWCHALLMAQDATNQSFGDGSQEEIMQDYRNRASELMSQYTEELKLAGWDLNISAIETQGGSRVTYDLCSE